MELDDLKAAWALLDQRAQSLESLVMRERQERRLEASRRVLRGLSVGQAVQFAVWIAVVATVAPFWIEYRQVSHLLLAGLTLHLYGVVTICATVLQLLLIVRTYYTAPVVIFQRRLLELHRFRVMSTLALGIPWFVLWIVATMVGAKWWFDLDLYARSPGWIQVSLLAGIVTIVCSVMLARWYAGRTVQSGMCGRMADDLGGLSLVRAARELAEVARFERE